MYYTHRIILYTEACIVFYRVVLPIRFNRGKTFFIFFHYYILLTTANDRRFPIDSDDGDGGGSCTRGRAKHLLLPLSYTVTQQ